MVGILRECALKESYRIAIRDAGMIRFLVLNLSISKNVALRTHCASALFKCAEDSETRQLIREFNGLEPLVALLDSTPSSKELLIAVTGAIWKCCENHQTNVESVVKLTAVRKLVALMESQPEDVLVNIVGALGACASTASGRAAIKESGGINLMVGLLTRTDQMVLVNATKAVGEHYLHFHLSFFVGACALDADCMAIIDRLDGVRLLWSLLKSTNVQVQASAAWAICPCIEHAKDAGEMVRSFVGGLELIGWLMRSENLTVR